MNATTFFEKLSRTLSKYMAVIVVFAAVLALIEPAACSWIKTSWINKLLGVVMFGMGITIKPSDFAIVFRRPRDIFFGFVAQFTIMPFLAYALSRLFNLPVELALGVILVGTCPGGTASNVITYLSKGDVPLSVGMTICSTFFAPILTPLLTKFYTGELVDTDVFAMFLSMIQVVLLPIFLGFIADRYFSKITEKVKDYLPTVSVIAIVMIVASIVSANAERIMQCSMIIIVVIMLHNLLGYAVGYMMAKLFRLDNKKCRTLSIEVGMQNSGLASVLATAHFAQYPLAAIPGAIFSVWHNISGAIYANILARNEK